MRILIQHRKDDKAYYNASTQELLEASALMVLGYNRAMGCYSPPLAPKPLDYNVESIPKLPEGLRAEAFRCLSQFRVRENCYRADLAKFNRIQEILQTKDGKAAWELLWKRRDNEYEEVELMEIIEPKQAGEIE